MAGNPKLRIRQVHVHGNKRTKASVFDMELQSAYQATHLIEIKDDLLVAANGLAQLGIFDSIDIKMDKVEGKVEETDVIITVKEKNWWKVNVGAKSDGYEGSAESMCTLINPLGTAEKLSASFTQGHVGSATTKLHYSKPHFMGLPWLLNVNGANETLVYERFSSYREKFRGGYISVGDEQRVHELSLNLGWRDIVPRRNEMVPNAFAASKSIIAEATPSMKTSMKYVYNNDSRDNPTIPSAGELVNCSAEVAGLLGDVNFVKGEVTLQRHFPVGPTVFGVPLLTLSLCSHLGAIKTYGLDAARSARISDRFFLGGPNSLRGFMHKGIGPRADPKDGGLLGGDALGGDVSYNLCATTTFPLPIPILAMFGFRGQFFANAGNLTGWDRVLDKDRWLKNLIDDTRTSVGVGVVLGAGIGRIEANYSWILQSHAQDKLKRGQFGISATFS